MFVGVNPNLTASEHWQFRVQAKKRSGKWRTLPTTYETKGAKQTRTLNLKRASYRVVVQPGFGYTGVTSRPVRLKR